METITLLPGDKRLKQLIKQFGNQWIVLKLGYAACFGDTAAHIESKCKTHKRWVEIKDIEYPPIDLELLEK